MVTFTFPAFWEVKKKEYRAELHDITLPFIGFVMTSLINLIVSTLKLLLLWLWLSSLHKRGCVALAGILDFESNFGFVNTLPSVFQSAKSCLYIQSHTGLSIVTILKCSGLCFSCAFLTLLSCLLAWLQLKTTDCTVHREELKKLE